MWGFHYYLFFYILVPATKVDQSVFLNKWARHLWDDSCLTLTKEIWQSYFYTNFFLPIKFVVMLWGRYHHPRFFQMRRLRIEKRLKRSHPHNVTAHIRAGRPERACPTPKPGRLTATPCGHFVQLRQVWGRLCSQGKPFSGSLSVGEAVWVIGRWIDWLKAKDIKTELELEIATYL